MNSLAPLLEQFTLPEISTVLRRTVLIGLAVGVVAFVTTLFLGQALGGLGACIGLALGLVNIRLITSQTAKVTREQPARPIRALASMTLLRLGVITVIAIGLAIVSKPLGLGTIFGVALFYLIFIANIAGLMVRHKGAS
jgi:hypothetical protein